MCGDDWKQKTINFDVRAVGTVGHHILVILNISYAREDEYIQTTATLSMIP